MSGTNPITGLTSRALHARPEENEGKRMHDDQDYTVIIKWINWFALEGEEMDVPLKRKRKLVRDMIILDDQDDDRPEVKKMRLSKDMLEDQRLSPMKHIICIERNNSELNAQQQKETEHNANKHNELGSNGESPSTQMVRPSGHITSSEIGKETILNKENSGEQTAISKSPSNHSAACDSEDTKCSSIGSELKCQPTPPMLITPRKSAHEVHGTSNDDENGVTCTEGMRSTVARVKSPLVQERHDAVVTFDNKAKMCDIRTIYKKSIPGNVQMKPTCDDIQNHGLVEHERPAKRMKETTKASTAGGTVVECPICQLALPGDMNDADFNTQINLHVDSCMRAAM